MKVLVAGGGTGGHLMPALAIGAALREMGADVVLVGAERGVEAEILPERDFPYHLLSLEPIYRSQWWKNLRWSVKGPGLLRSCLRLLKEEQPDFVVGTGGYAAGPLLFSARMKGIPVAIQEQNAFPGVTTRMVAPHARQVHLGFPEAADHLKVSRGEVYNFGNPVTPPPDTLPDRAELRDRLGVDPDVPVVLVMGGSQGARTINRALSGDINDGNLAGLGFLWSTGNASWKEFSHFTSTTNVVVRPFWDPIAEAYAACDLVVGRAGAMSTAEYCAWGLPSILIPLPTSAANHQTINARALESAGAAIHLPEAKLGPGVLARTISSVMNDDSQLDEMARHARARGAPDSARKIASQLVEIVS